MANKLPFPLSLLLLDAAGAVLAGLGAGSEFAGIEVIPLGFPHNGALLMVIGVAMMLPMIWHVIGFTRARLQEPAAPDDDRPQPPAVRRH